MEWNPSDFNDVLNVNPMNSIAIKWDPTELLNGNTLNSMSLKGNTLNSMPLKGISPWIQSFSDWIESQWIQCCIEWNASESNVVLNGNSVNLMLYILNGIPVKSMKLNGIPVNSM